MVVGDSEKHKVACEHRENGTRRESTMTETLGFLRVAFTANAKLHANSQEE